MDLWINIPSRTALYFNKYTKSHRIIYTRLYTKYEVTSDWKYRCQDGFESQFEYRREDGLNDNIYDSEVTFLPGNKKKIN